MTHDKTSFRLIHVQPVELLRAGSQLISDQYWMFVLVTLTGLMISYLIPMNILLGPMMCGMFFCFFRKMDGFEILFEDLFKGFNFLAQSLIAYLIIFGVTLGATLILYGVMMAMMIVMAAGSGDENVNTLFGGIFLFVVIGIILLFAMGSFLLSVFTAFTFPLIIDRNLGSWDAIKTSCRAVYHHFWGMLLLMLLNGLLAMVGLLLCIVPVFLVVPLTMAAVAIAYRDIFPPIPLENSELTAP